MLEDAAFQLRQSQRIKDDSKDDHDDNVIVEDRDMIKIYDEEA